MTVWNTPDEEGDLACRDQAWIDDCWPVAAPVCTCWNVEAIESFPEHCALPEHREAAREAS